MLKATVHHYFSAVLSREGNGSNYCRIHPINCTVPFFLILRTFVTFYGDGLERRPRRSSGSSGTRTKEGHCIPRKGFNAE